MISISESKTIVHGYSVIRVVTDEKRGASVPVGVVAWDSLQQWQRLRVLESDEVVTGLSKAGRRFLDIAVRQLRRWAKEEKVPYAPERYPPTSPHFWESVSRVMTTAVRVDSPRAMDPIEDPAGELEALYEAIVQPRQSKSRRVVRVDGILSRALGELSDDIPSRVEVSAFGDATETVRRGVVSDRDVLLIDGVNLAASRARDEADTLVSRFLRIQSAYSGRRVRIIVGYCSSPGGLNGEGHMKEWIQTQLTNDVYDLQAEREAFQSVAEEAWRLIDSDPQGRLL